MDNKTQAANKRRRARKPNGSFKADNPQTPHNDAYESTPIEEALSSKEVSYGVKQKVEGTSKSTAGKYVKKGKVRPTFGNVTSTTF
jgi:hypothetical protein